MQPRELANCLINCHGIPGHARWHILGPGRARACVFARAYVSVGGSSFLTDERRAAVRCEAHKACVWPNSRPFEADFTALDSTAQHQSGPVSEWRQVQVRCRSGQGGRRINNRARANSLWHGRPLLFLWPSMLAAPGDRRFLVCPFWDASFLLSFLFIFSLVLVFFVAGSLGQVVFDLSSYLEGAYALHCSCNLNSRSFPQRCTGALSLNSQTDVQLWPDSTRTKSEIFICGALLATRISNPAPFYFLIWWPGLAPILDLGSSFSRNLNWKFFHLCEGSLILTKDFKINPLLVHNLHFPMKEKASYNAVLSFLQVNRIFTEILTAFLLKHLKTEYKNTHVSDLDIKATDKMTDYLNCQIWQFTKEKFRSSHKYVSWSSEHFKDARLLVKNSICFDPHSN